MRRPREGRFRRGAEAGCPEGVRRVRGLGAGNGGGRLLDAEQVQGAGRSGSRRWLWPEYLSNAYLARARGQAAAVARQPQSPGASEARSGTSLFPESLE